MRWLKKDKRRALLSCSFWEDKTEGSSNFPDNLITLHSLTLNLLAIYTIPSCTSFAILDDCIHYLAIASKLLVKYSVCY
ncbi:hypothetical protein COLO4_24772 [Corchorus olitorius]|uniref:Uncharacterized protein n=1 Tax=Corchorus olitorius TaxID=93759 RepID=A0A1R3I758_9ROSI|nr:hypothetical protein COLO4_24772 [Corchorus olitorius]